jgi:hypothetical protein
VKNYEALARHPLAIAGAIITTASAVVFLALLIGMFAGLFEESPYAGLVVFVAVPALFVLGLLLVPLGMWLQKRKLARDPTAAADWPVFDFRLAKVRRLTLLFVALTAVNVIIVLVAGYGSLHFMESPTFCGQVCHTPMHPQFIAWEDASHAGVACARCHIGEGARGFVHAKASGVRQLAHVMSGSFPRPVPPGAHMLPGAQTHACSTCHRPGRIGGDLIRVIREYADDEANTETMTILQMHMGSGSSTGRAIHWHADPANRVEYLATDAGRQTIPYVKVTRANGDVKEYRAEGTDAAASGGELRPMECADCHNQVGHPISATVEKAVDRAIETAHVNRALPFARREGIRLLKASYQTEEAGLDAIDRGFREFYASRGGAIDQKAVAQSAAALKEVYRRNVFPTMKVTWGSYPDNRGHLASPGCTRCHDDAHTAKDGSTISGDCEYCHKQIEKPQ